MPSKVNWKKKQLKAKEGKGNGEQPSQKKEGAERPSSFHGEWAVLQGHQQECRVCMHTNDQVKSRCQRFCLPQDTTQSLQGIRLFLSREGRGSPMPSDAGVRGEPSRASANQPSGVLYWGWHLPCSHQEIGRGVTSGEGCQGPLCLLNFPLFGKWWISTLLIDFSKVHILCLIFF